VPPARGAVPVVCATIANDYEDIVDWGEACLAFLRRFGEFHFGVLCADWLRALLNRLDSDVFAAFRAWVADAGSGCADLRDADAKTSPRSHDRKAGRELCIGLRSQRQTGSRPASGL
jgi:hypothetical protein